MILAFGVIKNPESSAIALLIFIVIVYLKYGGKIIIVII